MSLIAFVDNLITTSFLFSPAIAKYMISRYGFLDNRATFYLVQVAIIDFIAFIVYGGVLGSDIGIPWFSVIYPIFLLAYNTIFYVKFSNFHLCLSISLVTVFLLNATHEVNLFLKEIIYNEWIPANLLFGKIPMHPFMWAYTIITGAWLFQMAKIKLSRSPILLLSLVLLTSFMPFFSSSIWSDSTPHHLAVSAIQFFLFTALILGFSGIEKAK